MCASFASYVPHFRLPLRMFSQWVPCSPKILHSSQIRIVVMKRIPAIIHQSHSFSQGYGTTLPTSLTYFILSIRGCLPWRPDADVGTNEWEMKSMLNFYWLSQIRHFPRLSTEFITSIHLSPQKVIPGIICVNKSRHLFPGIFDRFFRLLYVTIVSTSRLWNITHDIFHKKYISALL